MHDLNEIDKADRPVLYCLRRATSEEDLLHLRRPGVKLAAELNTLLDQVLLAIEKHTADHLPSDMDQVVLNEVVGHIDVVFVDCDLERKLIHLETIH